MSIRSKLPVTREHKKKPVEQWWNKEKRRPQGGV